MDIEQVQLHQSYDFTKSLKIQERINYVDRIKTASDIQHIVGLLEQHFIFYNLNEKELKNVAQNMSFGRVSAKNFIFEVGDYANCFFLIEDGVLEVIIDGRVKQELKKNDGFGELALLLNTNRSSSVRCQEDATLWFIDQQTYIKSIEDVIILQYEENKRLLQGSKFYNELSEEDKNDIAQILITQKYYKNQDIIVEGEPGACLYIIQEGTAKIFQNGQEIRTVTQGQVFGEQSLFYNTQRQVTIRADEDLKCLLLGREQLSSVLGENFHEVIFRNMIKSAFNNDLQKSTKLKNCQIQKIIDYMKLVYYKAGDTAINKGTSPNQNIIVVIEGQLIKRRDGAHVAKSGQVLWEPNNDEPFEDDIYMVSDGVLAEVSAQYIGSIFGVEINELIKNNKISQIKEKQLEEDAKKQMLDNIDVTSLILIQKLSKSQFGNIYLVKCVCDNNYYVMKAYSKLEVQQFQIQNLLIRQKQFLKQMLFPFIMKSYQTFSLDQEIYFLLEYVQGEDLYDVIRQIGLLNTYDAQFYTANMILILEYLHQNKIILRDVKPDSFIIDQNGYLKLIDYGIAKSLKSQENQNNKTFSIIGTPHYMAPEIISGKGYNLTSDLWSLGVCLYEFLSGQLPFGEDTDDPHEIFEQISNKELIIPDFVIDKNAIKLINQLIEKNADKRLGGSYDSLKQNIWFINFDFNKLLKKKLKAPYIPEACQKTLNNINEKSSKEDVNFKYYLQNLQVYLIYFQKNKKQESIITYEWESNF